MAETIDLTNLPPAPWHHIPGDNGGIVAGADDFPILLAERDDQKGNAALHFAALARNAFDVMLRRGWWPERFDSGRWAVWTDRGWCQTCDDPFTALVEADKWLTEQEKNRGT